MAEEGTLTAGTQVGTFDEGVEVTAKLDTLSARVTASVTVNPDPLAAVTLPAIKVAAGETLQLEAIVEDQYGNRISGLNFTWSVENGGGTIDDTGLFTAGTTPDTYKDTVKAEATHGDVTGSATADVTIEPDRIAFISDRNDDQFDIYIMDIDGTDVERLTSMSARE